MILTLILWSWPAYAFTPYVETEVEVAQEPKTPLNVETYTRQYFSDIPVLIQVAKCESQFRQWKNGEVLRGEINSDDVGVMQINEHYHLESSRRLGYDITTLAGNLQYARYLYENQGTKPWIWSKPCWSR